MTTTEVSHLVHAEPAAVFAALLDGDSVRRWMVPDGMTSEVHAFDGRAGGAFHISLTYDEGSEGVGKSEGRTDTFRGRFAEVVPDERVVQLVEFDSDDPGSQGEMRITYSLTDNGDGTTLVAGRHEGLPPGVDPADNELGWSISLRKLAALVEGQPDG